MILKSVKIYFEDDFCQRGAVMSWGEKFFKRNRDYKPLYRYLKKLVGTEETKRLFFRAGEELDALMKRFPDIPKGERNHTDNYIFPRVAIYRVLKRKFGDEAIKMIDDVVDVQGGKMGSFLRMFTSLPFAEKLFLRIFVVVAENMFGEQNGFALKMHVSSPDTVKFDILDCTYCRYCKKCGCPELIHTFCDSDEYCFGNLSKITFIRTQTLEHGEKCDFTLAAKHSGARKI
ncbi:L-2-amino-thiazoline-4-carboxylic acid hydrolase [Candidatus Allofournierella excrementigallinarum]|uniref:L-2-amino-thiazoline-4-carboxylic acid hydrolase n=1 Tax=Candidatus Allofournierella excrementigallinarum TaxID=2838592 RepID=UPI00374EDA5E